MMKRLIIDGSNLRSGGGVTHIIEVLNSIDDKKQPFDEVVLFSNTKTLSKIKERSWLKKETHPLINKSLLHIAMWKKRKFKSFLKQENNTKNTLLFSPTGTYAGFFKPYVGMSRNMLIFDSIESNRYGFSWMKFKFWLLRKEQIKSFENSKKVIFISNYAKETIQKFLKKNISNDPIIHHGVNKKFVKKPKLQKPISDFKSSHYKLLYISPITVYKHHVPLIRTVKKLYKEGYPIQLDLVGGSYPKSLKAFNSEYNSDDVYKEIVKYHGKVSYDTIENFYKTSNAFIFASTCENMPNILIEAMSAGLPVLCSSFNPMREFLGNNHPFYFDPTDEKETYDQLKIFLESNELRYSSAQVSFAKTQKYNWEKCAEETFECLISTLKQYYIE